MYQFKKKNYYKAVLIVSGGLSGGISSSIAGGNFWMGVGQGIITSGINHLGNHIIQEHNKSILRKQVEKAYGEKGAEALAKKDIGYIKTIVEKVPMLKKMVNHISDIKYKIMNQSVGDRYDETLSNLTINFDDEAFTSNLILATTIGHEFIHIQDYYNGNMNLWESDYGKHGDTPLYSSYRSEMEAWTWTYANAYDILPESFSMWEMYSNAANSMWNVYNKGRKWKY